MNGIARRRTRQRQSESGELHRWEFVDDKVCPSFLIRKSIPFGTGIFVAIADGFRNVAMTSE
jgi:hypothetical protein